MFLLKLLNWFNQFSYGSMLERHIVSRNPKSIYDIERLTREFEQKLSRGEI